MIKSLLSITFFFAFLFSAFSQESFVSSKTFVLMENEQTTSQYTAIDVIDEQTVFIIGQYFIRMGTSLLEIDHETGEVVNFDGVAVPEKRFYLYINKSDRIQSIEIVDTTFGKKVTYTL